MVRDHIVSTLPSKGCTYIFNARILKLSISRCFIFLKGGNLDIMVHKIRFYSQEVALY